MRISDWSSDVCSSDLAYREDKVDGASPSTQRAYQPVFRFLREVAGESAALASIDRIEGRRLFNLVCKLPSGIGKQKALRGLAVPDAIAEGARRSLPKIGREHVLTPVTHAHLVCRPMCEKK